MGTFPEVVFTCLSEDYSSYRDADSAVAHFRGEVPSPLVNDSAPPATSLDLHVSIDGEASWQLAIPNALDKPLKHIVLNKNVAAVQEACRPADFTDLLSMMNAIDFDFRTNRLKLPAAFTLVIRCGVLPKCPSYR